MSEHAARPAPDEADGRQAGPTDSPAHTDGRSPATPEPARFAGRSAAPPGNVVYRRVPPYTAFAGLYDQAMSAAVLPVLIDCFDESRRKFDVRTGIMADIGCGTGRFLKYLSRFRGRLYGVDISPAMLRLAGRRLEGTGTRLMRMDMRALRLPEPVETLTCTFDTVNYLVNDADLERAFAGFAANLKPGGMLIFDFIPQGPASAETRARQRIRLGNLRSNWRIRLAKDGTGSAVRIEIELLDHSGESRYYAEVHRQRWHPTSALEMVLGRCRFDLLETRPVEAGRSEGWTHCVARLRF